MNPEPEDRDDLSSSQEKNGADGTVDQALANQITYETNKGVNP